jgi:hypothetical protein
MPLALVVTLLTAAAFPAPTHISYDDALKFGSGHAESFDPKGGMLVVEEPAGPVTYSVAGAVFATTDGTPYDPRALQRGAPVSIWYHVDRGASAKEIDVGVPVEPVAVVPLLPMTPENVKHVTGTLRFIDPSENVLVLQAPAGSVWLRTDNAPAYGRDHQRILLTQLKPGQTLEIDYYVHAGALAQKIDVVEAPPPPPQRPPPPVS